MTDTDYDANVFDNDGVSIEITDRGLLADAIQAAVAEFNVRVPDDVAREMVAADDPPDESFRDEDGIDLAAFWERREAIRAVPDEYRTPACRRSHHRQVRVTVASSIVTHSLARSVGSRHRRRSHRILPFA